ncbi:MAG TPA: nucleotidyltransferase family protein [Vicinamibacterales bacterium]
MQSTSRPAAVLETIARLLPENPEACGAMLQQESAWPALVEQARLHGFTGLLAGAGAGLRQGPPPDILRALELHRAVSRAWYVHQWRTLEEILAAFAAGSVRAAVLKGPWLAHRLYPEPSDRHAVDLDVLIARADLDRALGILTAAGWHSGDGPAARYARRHHHHVQVTRDGSPPLELHFRARAGFGTIVESEPLLARASAARTPAGHQVLTLAPEDEFVYLALHAAGHAFARLIWLYDLKLLLRANPGFDWVLAATRAGQIGAGAPVAFACRLLRERLGLTIPPLPALRGTGPRHALARAVQRRVVADAGPLAIDRLGGLAFTSLLSRSPLAALRLWSHHTARGLKRRMHRVAPRLVSPDWSG